MKTVIPHAVWAAVALATYFAGTARQNAAPETTSARHTPSPEPTSGPSSTRVDATGSPPYQTPTAIPSARSDRSSRSEIPIDLLLEDIEKVFDGLRGDDNPIRALASLTPAERVATGKAMFLATVARHDEMLSRSVQRNDMFGIPDESFERLLRWSLAPELVESRDPFARQAAFDELQLSNDEIAEIDRKARANRAKRNAQNLASVYSAAVAAGADFSAAAGARELAQQLVEGIYGGADAGFDTTLFKVPDLSPEEFENALVYLAEDLSYRSSD